MAKLNANSLRLKLSVIRNTLTDYVLKHYPEHNSFFTKYHIYLENSRQSVRDDLSALVGFLDRNFPEYHSSFKKLANQIISSNDGKQILHFILLLRELEVAPEWTLDVNASRLNNMAKHFLGGNFDEIQAALLNAKENAKEPEKWGNTPFFNSMRMYINDIITRTKNTTNPNTPLTAAILSERERISVACAIVFDYLHTSQTLGSLNDTVEHHEICQFIDVFYIQGEYAFGAFPEIEAIKNTYHFAELMQKVNDLPTAYQWGTEHGKKNIISLMAEMMFAYDLNKFIPVNEREKMPFNLFMVGLWLHQNAMFEQLPLLNDVCRNMSAANALGKKMAKQYHAIQHLAVAKENAENAFEQYSQFHERINQWLDEGNPLPSYFSNLKRHQNLDDFVAFELSGAGLGLARDAIVDLEDPYSSDLETILSDFIAKFYNPQICLEYAPAWYDLFRFLGDKRPNFEDNEQIATLYPDLIAGLANAIQERAKHNDARHEPIHEALHTVFNNVQTWYDLLNDELSAVEDDDFNVEAHIHERAMLNNAIHIQQNYEQPLIVRGQSMAIIGMDFGKPFLPFNELLLNLESIEQSIWAAKKDELAQKQQQNIDDLEKRVNQYLNPTETEIERADADGDTNVPTREILEKTESEIMTTTNATSKPQIPDLDVKDFADEISTHHDFDQSHFEEDLERQAAIFLQNADDIAPIQVAADVQPMQQSQFIDERNQIRPITSPAVLELLAHDIHIMPRVRFIPAQDSLPQVSNDETHITGLNDLKQRIENWCLLVGRENSIKSNKIADFKVHTHALKQTAAACRMTGIALVFWLMDWHLKYVLERAAKEQDPYLKQPEFDVLSNITAAIRTHIVENQFYPAANHSQLTTPNVWEMPFFEWLKDVKALYPLMQIRDNVQFIDYTKDFPEFYNECANKENAIFLTLPQNEQKMETATATTPQQEAHAPAMPEAMPETETAPVVVMAATVEQQGQVQAVQQTQIIPQQIIVPVVTPQRPIEVVENGIKVHGKVIPFEAWFNNLSKIENAVHFLNESLNELKKAESENSAALYPNEERAYQNIADCLFAMNLQDLGLIFYDVGIAHNDDVLPMPTKIAIQINEVSCSALEILIEKNYDNLPWHSFEIIKLMTQRARQSSGVLLSLMNQNEQQEKIATALGNVAKKVSDALNELDKSNHDALNGLKNNIVDLIKRVDDLNAKQQPKINIDDWLGDVAIAIQKTENRSNFEAIFSQLNQPVLKHISLVYSALAPFEAGREHFVEKQQGNNPNIIMHPVGQTVVAFMKENPEYQNLLKEIVKECLAEQKPNDDGNGKSLLSGLFKK